MRVVVALSGGVDSAVAAALLLRQGHEVVAATLRLLEPPLTPPGEGDGAVASARQVAARLGVRHEVVDAGDAFRAEVLTPFVEAYLGGETPSPCTVCNPRVKFPVLLEAAARLGADRLATGHYARVETGEDGRVRLLRGSDPRRDQSYFLFALGRERLERVLFPLGRLGKDEVRRLAGELGLPNARRRDSQDVCFAAPGEPYTDVLRRLAPGRTGRPGSIVDTEGKVLGRHAGIHLFTVGQRRGLGLAGTRARYVVDVAGGTGTVVVGIPEEASRREITLRDVCWLRPVRGVAVRAGVQVRSRHGAQDATIHPDAGGSARVVFDEPAPAPAPGQAAVFYDGDEVLGGGWIVRDRATS